MNFKRNMRMNPTLAPIQDIGAPPLSFRFIYRPVLLESNLETLGGFDSQFHFGFVC